MNHGCYEVCWWCPRTLFPNLNGDAGRIHYATKQCVTRKVASSWKEPLHAAIMSWNCAHWRRIVSWNWPLEVFKYWRSVESQWSTVANEKRHSHDTQYKHRTSWLRRNKWTALRAQIGNSYFMWSYNGCYRTGPKCVSTVKCRGYVCLVVELWRCPGILPD